ncbi:MAG TPA: hypothetical protein VNT99_01695 [Methylomirabilota bacterium]|nr:hypothetical protein [Methylomirabilota bacterium]
MSQPTAKEWQNTLPRGLFSGGNGRDSPWPRKRAAAAETSRQFFPQRFTFVFHPLILFCQFNNFTLHLDQPFELLDLNQR